MKEGSEHPIEVRQEARDEIEAAYLWYFSEEPSWGEGFLEDLERGKWLICRAPSAFPNKYKDYRDCPLERYPYILIYALRQGKVVLFSVFHTSRDTDEKYPE